MSVNQININAVNERTRKIKPVCKCACGRDVFPTKEEAGRFVTQFRKKIATKQQLSDAGKKGAVARWGKKKV